MALSNANPHIAPRIEKYEDTKRSAILPISFDSTGCGFCGHKPDSTRRAVTLYPLHKCHHQSDPLPLLKHCMARAFICSASSLDKAIVFHRSCSVNLNSTIKRLPLDQ